MVYFANFFKLAAEAETHALNSLGWLAHGSKYYWPRVHAEADYRHPLHFNEDAEVEAGIAEMGHSSVHWEHRIRANGVLCAVLRIVAVRTTRGNVPVPLSDEEKRQLSPLLQ